jgi:tetratricopeptide (TPR) repeat protein
MHRSSREKLVAVLLGMLFLVLALELGLRILGSRYPLMDPSRDVAALVESCPDCRRILCVGDSYTYGIGASAGMDFPALLQQALRERGEQVQVFNAGIPGANTGYVLAALDGYLETTQPAQVVVLAGGANRHNLFGLRAYQQRSRVGARIEEWLFRIRVVRFVRNAARRLRTQREDREAGEGALDMLRETSGPDLYARWRLRDGRPVDPDFERGGRLLAVGDLDGAQAVFERGSLRQPDDAAWQWGLAECSRGRREYAGAQVLYERAIALDPTDAVSHYAVGELFQDRDDLGNPAGRDAYLAGVQADPAFARNYCGMGRWEASVEQDLDAAVDWFERGIEADPGDRLCYSQLAVTVQGTSHAARLQAVLDRYAQDGIEAADLLPSGGHQLSAEVLSAWIRGDLRRIVDLSEARGAQVVLQTYPQALPANAVIRTVAAETGAPLLDMQQRLEALTAAGTDVGSLTIADGHYSDQGNRMTAEALAQLLSAR